MLAPKTFNAATCSTQPQARRLPNPSTTPAASMGRAFGPDTYAAALERRGEGDAAASGSTSTVSDATRGRWLTILALGPIFGTYVAFGPFAASGPGFATGLGAGR